MNPRLPLLLALLLVPVVEAASTKQRSVRETLSPNSRPETVERAVADSLQDLLDAAGTFFADEGPRSVRPLLRMPGGEGKIARGTGTLSRTALAAMTVKLQEQASAALADLSTVMRGAQERLSRPPARIDPDTRRHYEQMIEEARELTAAVSGYLNQFKQATRGEIGQWISYELPAPADKRGRTGKVTPAPKSAGSGQVVSGFLVY